MKLKKQVIIFAFFAIGIILGTLIPRPNLAGMDMENQDMDLMASRVVSYVDFMHETLIGHGKFRCCLKKPCTYCITEEKEKGEDVGCDCLAEIVNGEHPCGECMGEILEGNGNPLLSEYFAKAISDEIGHYDTVRQIISEKYNISIEDQL